jgi:acetyl esterase/lipase
MKPFFLLLIGVSFFAAAHSQDTLSYTQSEIIYGRKDGMALTLIKLAPKKQSKGKGIITVVSGNWVSNYSMLPGFIRHAANYVNSGYTMFLVMHGSQPRYAINDEAEDLKRAVRFVRFNAKEYGIDPAHIGITGYSSGGHLALMTALADDHIDLKAKDPVDRVSSRVQAAAVFYPPADFLNWGAPNKTNDKKALVKYGVAAAFDFKVLSAATGMYEHDSSATDVEIAKETSPISLVTSDDPPVSIIHGDKDMVVPLQQSQSIIEKLKAAGVPNELFIREGGNHGWANMEAEEKRFILWFDKYL